LIIEWPLVVELLLLGTGTGFLAGLLGIGGGMLMVPVMTLLFSLEAFPPEHVIKMAVATSLATICFTSISSVRAHHLHGAVRWDIVKLLAPGIVVGSYAGSWLATLLNSRVLALFFALFVGVSATQMLLGKKPAQTRQLPRPVGMLAAGSGIGALSGMVGAGGGFIAVPFMSWCNVPIHHAVATSAALGFPIAVAGTLSYVLNGMHIANLPRGAVGYVYTPALIVISLASVLMAPLGARTAHRLDVRQLKRAFALLLYALAAYMLYKAVRP
jgi:uncharacterized membrane protein YfcA